jgi:diadenosine tetraphosphate (Ap4A) HIT family hydrolase
MIILKRHANSFVLTSIESEEFFKITQKFFDIFKKDFNASGINLFTNIGQSAGQNILHLHFHLISRTSDEKISPFALINDKNLYKTLQQLTEKEILEKVNTIKKASI